MNVLEEILLHKKKEIEFSKQVISQEELKKRNKFKSHSNRYFQKSLNEKVKKNENGLIAEIKKASPSKGLLRADFNPEEISIAYKNGGATCLSVLTDEKYFQGNKAYIKKVKEKVSLPILRKDFIIDPYQIYESVDINADCILLIVSALKENPFTLYDLYNLSIENELDVLLEVHDEREVEIALALAEKLKTKLLLGINNRNLKTFETSINTTINLVQKYKKDFNNHLIISESGISDYSHICDLNKSNVFLFLVGESLVKEKDIEAATKKLLFNN